MPIWNKFIKIWNGGDSDKTSGYPTRHVPRYAIIDIEVGLSDHKIHDIGALRDDGATFHKASKKELFDFLEGMDYVCGHNIIHHDARYLFADRPCHWKLVDTLYVSPCCSPNALTTGW